VIQPATALSGFNELEQCLSNRASQRVGTRYLPNATLQTPYLLSPSLFPRHFTVRNRAVMRLVVRALHSVRACHRGPIVNGSRCITVWGDSSRLVTDLLHAMSCASVSHDPLLDLAWCGFLPVEWSGVECPVRWTLPKYMGSAVRDGIALTPTPHRHPSW
jgi:hypothetical protein